MYIKGWIIANSQLIQMWLPLLLVSILGFLSQAQKPTISIWPIPQYFEVGQGEVRIDPPNLRFQGASSEILAKAISRFQQRINDEKYTSPLFSYVLNEVPSKLIQEIQLSVQNDEEWIHLETDESYIVNIPADSETIQIQSHTPFGAMRALESISQMIKYDSKHKVWFIPQVPLKIEDRPKFAHRGISLDTSRNYYPVETILKLLETMSWNKMNVFHWHIVDSHSFPLDSEVLPEFGQKGSYGEGFTYSKQDVNKIVEFANDRGIRVIPELDMPGHSYSWGLAFPEITVCPNIQPNWEVYAASPPSGQLNPILPKTYEVVKQLIDEQSKWFPDSYFHTGGDEVNMKCWETSDSIMNYSRANGVNLEQILQQFVSKAHQYVEENQKIPIVWQEMLLSHHLTFSKDTIIQVWLGNQDVRQVVEKGFRALSSSYEFWYLDCGHGAWLGNWVEGNSWCDPYKTWQKVYSYHLTKGLTEDQAKLVLGGEVMIWSEQIDDQNIERMLWPRGAAAAEILWSGNTDHDGNLRTVNDALPRLNEWRYRMVARGCQAEPLQPMWCARNPGNCDLNSSM